jgi:adenosine kinase
MSILLSGSLVYDHIMNFPDSFKNHIMPNQLHVLSVAFMIDKLKKGWGGTAGNIAYTIKLLGGDPLIVSALGQDGKEYLDHLHKVGINTEYIAVVKDKLTASAYITTDQDDNQITAFYNGPLGAVEKIDLRPLTDSCKYALISPNPKNVMTKHLIDCADLQTKVLFDPGQQITAFAGAELQKLVSQADYLIGNDYEIKLIMNRTGWDRNKLAAQVDALVITLGERGSVIIAKGELVEVAASSPKSHDDPTGAGDAYRAGFFVGLDQELSYRECGQLGSVAASYAIENYGTQAHRFTMDEFRGRYKKTYVKNCPL